MLQNRTLELAALSPSIESLNEVSLKLRIDDFTLKKVQSLTQQWSQKTATALERCSVLEGTQNNAEKFFQKCENWIKFLEKMDEALKSNIPGWFEELQEQQKVYEVSLHKQEIDDRLNAWVVFNEKNKELCSWLVQMESKVLQTADVSIEDMIDKLEKNRTLELAALSPSIESLNEVSLKLRIDDFTLKKVQSLTQQWSQKTATALERCSVLEGTQNNAEKFFQKCENWIKFLEKMDEALKSNIPGWFEELQEQQKVYEVSLHKQEIDDRLNAWVVFNEKNKELCSWLVQMESKVLQTADVSIEDMIDKLEKDCMEEINLFSENKLQLKQISDQLMKASNKS